jgi:nucleoside phosphorylase
LNHFNFKNILFCSAIQTEIDGLDSRIVNKQDLGVGNIDSSIRLTEYITNNQNIQEIVFIGSAGSYNLSLSKIGDICFGNIYHYREISTWKGESSSPHLFVNKIFPSRGELGNFLFQELQLIELGINSPNSITNIITQNLPTWENSPILENMEVFGLARVATLLNKNFSSILGITNQVYEKGSEEWKMNYKEVAKKLINKINSALRYVGEN